MPPDDRQVNHPHGKVMRQEGVLEQDVMGETYIYVLHVLLEGIFYLRDQMPRDRRNGRIILIGEDRNYLPYLALRGIAVEVLIDEQDDIVACLGQHSYLRADNVDQTIRFSPITERGQYAYSHKPPDVMQLPR